MVAASDPFPPSRTWSRPPTERRQRLLSPLNNRRRLPRQRLLLCRSPRPRRVPASARPSDQPRASRSLCNRTPRPHLRSASVTARIPTATSHLHNFGSAVMIGSGPTRSQYATPKQSFSVSARRRLHLQHRRCIPHGSIARQQQHCSLLMSYRRLRSFVAPARLTMCRHTSASGRSSGTGPLHCRLLFRTSTHENQSSRNVCLIHSVALKSTPAKCVLAVPSTY
jgi:hypothetical protein